MPWSARGEPVRAVRGARSPPGKSFIIVSLFPCFLRSSAGGDDATLQPEFSAPVALSAVFLWGKVLIDAAE